jgi:hypothetical protein
VETKHPSNNKYVWSTSLSNSQKQFQNLASNHRPTLLSTLSTSQKSGAAGKLAAAKKKKKGKAPAAANNRTPNTTTANPRNKTPAGNKGGNTPKIKSGGIKKKTPRVLPIARVAPNRNKSAIRAKVAVGPQRQLKKTPNKAGGRNQNAPAAVKVVIKGQSGGTGRAGQPLGQRFDTKRLGPPSSSGKGGNNNNNNKNKKKGGKKVNSHGVVMPF